MLRPLLLLLSIITWGTSLHAQDLYDLYRVQELRIYFDSPTWEQDLATIKSDKSRIPARVQLNGKTYDQVGVRFKGNSSYNNAVKVFQRKIPFNLDANEYLPQQQFEGGYTKLKLANGFRDPSFLREVLAYRIARDYMHAPRANFMRVYVNDQYYGLYNSIEAINGRFALQEFGVDGLLYKCDQDFSYERPTRCRQPVKPTLAFAGMDSVCYQGIYEPKSGAPWLPLLQLMQTLERDPTEVGEQLDINAALWMLAFNSVLVNLDSYSGRLAHNYYLLSNGRSQLAPVVWDMNLAFGGFTYDGDKDGPLTFEEMKELSPFLHYRDAQYPLISQLLQDEDNRLVYLAMMRTILEDWFNNGKYRQEAQRVQQFIDAQVQQDEQKFYSYASFKRNLDQSAKAGKSNIIGITELMEGRKQYLNNHPLFNRSLPNITDARHTKSGSDVTITASYSGADEVVLYYRGARGGAFKRIPMQLESGRATTTILATEVTEYYLVAKGDKAASVAPRKVGLEYYKVE